MRISRTALSCLLRLKAYGTYPAGLSRKTNLCTARIWSSAGPRMERPSRAGHDPRRRVRAGAAIPEDGREQPHPGGFATGRLQKKETSPQDRTQCSILACRQPSPGSPPQCPIVRRLSQPRSPNSASPNESAWRHSCEGGPTVRQIGSRNDPRSDPREFPREAQAVQEVRR